MPKIILDLNDRRPAWALPPWVAEEIREALPKGWRLQVMEGEADGSGDGMLNLDPALAEAAREAEVYLGYGVPASLLDAGPGLGWVHSGAAGVRGSLTPQMLASPVLFTNSKGIHGPPMADTALGMILYFARGLDFGVAAKARGAWDKDPFYAGNHPLVELEHATVGIYGFGGIGREVAKRVVALGARTLAFGRGPESFREGRSRYRDRSGRLLDARGGDAAGASEAEVTVGKAEIVEEELLSSVEPLFGPQGFGRLLSESDFLVLTAPETAETRGAFHAGALDRMKPTATLINISRGRLVEEDALVAALKSGRLRGAGLDVFAREPLPGNHPLWGLPNVLITPHVSAVTRHFWRRQTDLILENLRRYLAGEPLLNLVDKTAGY